MLLKDVVPHDMGSTAIASGCLSTQRGSARSAVERMPGQFAATVLGR